VARGCYLQWLTQISISGSARPFQFLSEQRDLHGDAVLLREARAKSFEGQRVPLIAGQDIFWPDNDGVERWVVSRPPGLNARGRESSIRPLYAPACLLGVEQRALLVG
jgi:hypothetical protein